MDGKQAILNKILDDAKASASEILKTATDKAEQTIGTAKKFAEEYTETQKKILQRETREIVERKVTVAELDVRKNILKAKQDLIEDVFAIALDKLCSLGKTYYSRLVFKLLDENAEENDVIVLSSDGVMTRADFISNDTVKSLSLKISKTAGDFKGGIKLIGKYSDKDLTFKTLISDLKEQKTSEVASLLF